MLKEYFRAVKKDWVARMSGPAAIILAFLGLYFDYIARHGKAALWIAAAICLLITSYRVWANERKALIAEKEKNLKPEITGEIEEVHIDWVQPKDVPFEKDKSLFECFFTIKARIVNVRPVPTTLRFDLWVHGPLTDCKTAKSNLGGLLFDKKLHETDFIRGTFVGRITEQMPSLEEQSKIPLTMGEEREGWLRCVLLRADDPTRKEIDCLRLEVKDAYGGTHNIFSPKSEWRKTGEITTPRDREIPKSGL